MSKPVAHRGQAVIDLTKVVRIGPQKVASITFLLLDIEAAISWIPGTSV